MQEAYLSLTTKTLVFLQHVTQQYEADFIMKVCRASLALLFALLSLPLLANRRHLAEGHTEKFGIAVRLCKLEVQSHF